MKTQISIFGHGLILSMAVAATLSVASSAQAKPFQEATSDRWSDSFGNDSVNGGVSMASSQSGSEYAVSGTRYRSSDAQVYFGASAKLFNNSIQPLWVSSGSYAKVERNLTSGTDSYQTNATGNIFVMGSIIYSSGNVACGNNRVCASHDEQLSRTLFSASDTFFLGPVPVTVNGSLVGSVHGGVSSSAAAPKYLGLSGTILAGSTGQLNSGATLTARLGAEVNFWVVGIGITTSIDVLSASLTPQASGRFAIYDEGAGGSWTNTAPLALSTLNGTASLWGQVFGIPYNRTITTWSGYSFPVTNFWDHSGGARY